MLSRRIARASPLRSIRSNVPARRLPLVQQRNFMPDYREEVEKRYPPYPSLTDAEDPEMNGGFSQPPPIKRQFRDPHGDWWDKQERRNYNEPIHEDYDTLGMFTTYQYTWISPGKGILQIGMVIAAFFSMCYCVKLTYPDVPAYPREFEGGLERELGGPGAMRARAPGDPKPFQDNVDVD